MRCLLRPNTHAYKRLNGSYILNIGYDYLIVHRLQSTMLGILGLRLESIIQDTMYKSMCTHMYIHNTHAYTSRDILEFPSKKK